VGALDIVIIVFGIVVVLGAGFYFLNRWATKRYSAQQEAVSKNKVSAKIFVIDKKHDKADNVNLPKVIMENLPKTAKVTKMYFVMAKVEKQIVTLMCDKANYNFLEPKKTYQVELAGIYIASVKGAKSQFEVKEAKKAKRKEAKEKKKP